MNRHILRSVPLPSPLTIYIWPRTSVPHKGHKMLTNKQKKSYYNFYEVGTKLIQYAPVFEVCFIILIASNSMGILILLFLNGQ